MKEFTAIAEITFLDIDDITEKNENIILTEVSSFTDAMPRIEEYYGKDLISAKITLVEGPYLIVSDEVINKLKTGETI